MKQKFAAKLWKRTLSTGLSLAMAVTMIPTVGVLAVDSEAVVLQAGSISAADNRITRNQPFTSQTGSSKFASPAFTVRKVVEYIGSDNRPTRPTTGMTSDLLIAAAEAKYDTVSDGGGQDIIASVSSDGGKTWNYSYPFNFPDSAASGNEDATTVSNPVLVEDTQSANFVTGGTIYCLANVYPGGVAPAAGFTYPGVGTGYVEIDQTKYLALADTYEKATVNPTDGAADYAYYVGAFAADGYAPVNDKTTKNLATIDSNSYYVDKWYNLYTKSGETYTKVMQDGGQLDAAAGAAGQLQQNVFYKNSKLHVYNTGYIMCVTSSDGKTWSTPEILNPQVYRDEEEIVFLSSGKGLKTSGNRLVVPVYSKKDAEAEDEKASIIWKYDACEHGTAGTPWQHRSNDVAFNDGDAENPGPTWTKGGEIVEMSRGQLRMFLRHGRDIVYYADAGRGADAGESGETTKDVENVGASPDMFVFSDPVATQTSMTRDAKVSALEYSKVVNPESSTAGKVILTAMPTGSGHTNGMINIFGKTGENLKNPAISRIHSNNLTNGNFASASMDEMNYGNNVGLLWENGIGSVRFDSRYMLDVLAHGTGSDTDSLYVAGLEYDLELRPNGEAYTRKYNVTGQGNMEPSDRVFTAEGGDNFDVTFSPGRGSEKKAPAMYSLKADWSSGQSTARLLKDAYNAQPDAAVDIEKAEFTLLRSSEADLRKNDYVIYSENAERYLTALNYDTLFSTTARNTMRLVYDETNNGFLLSQADPNNLDSATAGKFYINYDAYCHTFVRNTSASATVQPRYKDRLYLFRKLTAEELASETLDSTKVISLAGEDGNDYKYIQVNGNNEIESGRKYLIGYPVAANSSDDTFPKQGYVLLYPRNNTIAHAKLVYGTRDVVVSATKTLTITPKAATAAPVDLTVNNITYHITVKNETISVPKGGSAFVDNVSIDDVNLGTTNLVTAMATKEDRKALFDCRSESNNNLNGYDTTPNWEANVANAEFIITETGQTADNKKTYHIFSELEGNYLANSNASSYFANEAVPQTLELTEAGADAENASFEIRRYTPSNQELNNRYVYFFYEKMGFDAVDRKSGFETRGDFGFEFLKKRTDGMEDMSDPILGYQRVNEITSGESYLITEYYTETVNGRKRDVIIVLYPRNGIVNQSKMYATTEVNGVKLTAGESADVGNKADIIIGGTTYTVEIEGECDHEGYPKTINSIPATCKHPGSTGNVICSHCREIIEEGEEIPQLNHTWPEDWTVITEASINRTAKTVTDGEETRTCEGGEETETRVVSGTDYLKKVIGDTIKNAAAEAAKTDEYAAESIAALNTAIAAATEAVSGQSPADTAGQIEALVALEEALKSENLVTQGDFNTRKKALTDLISDAEKAAAKTDVYTADSLQNLEDVLSGIKEELDEMSYTELQTALTNLQTAVDSLKTLDEEKCEEMLPQLKSELAAAESIASAGQKNYTDESWKKFKDAYDALYGKTDDELKAMGAVKLADLLAGLKTQLKEKSVEKPNPLKLNEDHTIGGAVYTVTDAVKNEIVLKKGANTNKFTIPAVQQINGVTCKVVGIGDNAFKNCKKLKNVTIGEHVVSIGKNAFFKCTKLSKVTVNGSKAPAIGKGAFKKTASKVTVKAKKLNKKQKKAFLKKLKKTGKISSKSVVK